MATVAALCLAPAPARAQACCAGANAIAPGRLALHEDALVGLQIRGAYVIGSFDGQSRFHPSPAGAVEVDLEEALLGSLRVAERAQLTALVPVAQTFRRAGGLAEVGGGLGDVQIGARYDFVLAGESLRIPGIALLAAVTVPTGIPPEQARKPLATDATGLGFVRLAGALALEQQFGRVLVNVTGTVAWASPRVWPGPASDAQDGVSLAAFAALGWVFPNSGALAITGAYSDELPGSVAGARSGDGRAALRLGLAGGSPVSDHWRLSGGAFVDAPGRWLGRGQPAQAGLTLLVIRSWS